MTRLLRRMEQGDRAAADELFELVYAELRRRARKLMANAGPQTLQPTAVIHEAWLKLSGGNGAWNDRGHFLAVAAKAMRTVLVDRARARNTTKRGGADDRGSFDRTSELAAMEFFEQRGGDLVELDAALEGLQKLDPELARIVELRFFAGLSIAETARALETSTATVERAWRTARSWLRARLDGEAS